MPKKIWLEIRARDLARAIAEYMAAGDHETVLRQGWIGELDDLLRQIDNTPFYAPTEARR